MRKKLTKPLHKESLKEMEFFVSPAPVMTKLFLVGGICSGYPNNPSAPERTN